MVTPRRSARVASLDSSPNYNEDETTGTKRKSKATGSSPSAKRGKKNAPKKQQTIEDAMDIDQKEEEEGEDEPDPEEEEDKPSGAQAEAPKLAEEKQQTVTEEAEEPKAEPESEQPAAPTESAPASAPEPPKEEGPGEKPNEPTESAPDAEPEKKPKLQANGATETSKPSAETTEEKQEDTTAQDTSKTDSTGAIEPKEQTQPSAPATNGDAIEPEAREDDVPSSILEKGIVYFFFRPRVNVSDPQDVSDIARSYMVLRPIPHGAKLGDGTIGDDNNARLIAIPKKVLPLSGKDRFMAFVEKSKVSFSELKNDFMSASDYATKTAGTSHTPPVTPLAEGVYAITTTGRESHLAYITTIPNELSEVQKDVGIRESGSFIVSAKSPKFPGPANTNIGSDPGYSEEIMNEFRDLRWMPLQPKLLDYASTQFLLIGESSGIEKATEQMPRDEKSDKETPMEEMEKLEGEDEIRVKHLKGDDAVFADLGLSKKEYPQVPTTW